MSEQQNRETVNTLWHALSARDWDTLKSCLTDDIHYEDVPTEDTGAIGPENVVKRLRIAFAHLIDHNHEIHHLAIDGDLAMLDHTETWTFKTGEKAVNRFATIHEMRDGKVAQWSDIWDVNKFISQFPGWFLEEMAKAHAADFGATTET
ncbi:MAG: nuclear transport factor 2 family protein [bacterium]